MDALGLIWLVVSWRLVFDAHGSKKDIVLVNGAGSLWQAVEGSLYLLS